MTLLILLYPFVIVSVITIVIIQFKLIRPQKKLYDTLRAQGVTGEPFVPLAGQAPEMNKKNNNDMVMTYHEELVKKHGHVFLIGFGPFTRLIINEPDLLADVLSRRNAYNYVKPADTSAALIPILGEHNLFVVEGSEHERARRMINPAFYHANLKSMISIISYQTAKAIESVFCDEKNSKPIDLRALFNDLTLSIIASSAFGTDFEKKPTCKRYNLSYIYCNVQRRCISVHVHDKSHTYSFTDAFLE